MHKRSKKEAYKDWLGIFVHDCLLLTLVSIIEDTATDMQLF